MCKKSLPRQVRVIVSLLVLAVSVNGDEPKPETAPSLLPIPKSLQIGSGSIPLTDQTKVVATDAKLIPLANVVVEEIWRLSGLRMATTTGEGSAGDIVLQFDKNLKAEQHSLDVTDRTTACGGSYRGVAWATVSLIQALKLEGNRVTVPRISVRDEPDISFRSAECDIARKWHPIANLYELIDLFRFYEISHIQFHLNDHGMFTFGSKNFPKLVTFRGSDRRHYTIE